MAWWVVLVLAHRAALAEARDRGKRFRMHGARQEAHAVVRHAPRHASLARIIVCLLFLFLFFILFWNRIKGIWENEKKKKKKKERWQNRTRQRHNRHTCCGPEAGRDEKKNSAQEKEEECHRPRESQRGRGRWKMRRKS
jgi:hypothetical protein